MSASGRERAAEHAEPARSEHRPAGSALAAGPEAAADPERAALRAALARLARGTPWKAALEALLLELDPAAADHLQQVLREARGSWLCLLRASLGRALFVGDPLSGTVVALARAGFRVTVAGDDPLRLALARARAAALSGPIDVVVADALRPPVRGGAFDLAVVEGDPRTEVARAAAAASRGEVAWIAPNRLAYKGWSGRRGAFRVRRPLELARAALDPRRPEATLAGYRRRLAACGLGDVRAFALYPHALDFALIAALDRGDRGGRGGRGGLAGGGPRLFVGPKERENRPKVVAYRLGALPLFTPSFALLATRATGPARIARIERVLSTLAERLGEPLPEVEQWIASRGNTTIVHAGDWTLHVPHQPAQARQARRHYERLVELRARFPDLPVPDPLFAGELEGLAVFCERRVRGLTAPQAVGRTGVLARTFADCARLLAGLVVERATVDAALFDALVRDKVALVRRHAAVASTERWLDAALERAADRMLGRELPLVVQHADLRSKHVVIDAEGGVRGLLDWGSSEPRDLPFFDLLHLVVHERKQAGGLSAGEAWRRVIAPGGARPHERAALDDHAARLGLAPDVRAALEELYPVLVAAMAERNWDFSRPRWLHASFGV
jgi:hypothetical protein